MYAVDPLTMVLRFAGNPVKPTLNGQPYLPGFVVSPAGPSFSLNSDGCVVVSGAAEGQLYTVSSTDVDVGCDTTQTIPPWSFIGPDDPSATNCQAIVSISVSPSAVSGEAGDSVTFNFVVNGGDAQSLPQWSAPTGFPAPSGTHPNYSSTGQISESGILVFSATNSCSGVVNAPVSVSINQCDPIVVDSLCESAYVSGITEL